MDDRTGKNKIAIAGSGSRNGGTSSNTTILPSNALQQCIKQNGFDVNEKSCLCGSKICDAASGLVCNIDGEDCSSPCLGGENCCSIFFEEKDSPGCTVTNDNYCIAASKAVFVVGETEEDLVREDVIIACGAECLELKYSEIQMNTLGNINLADMIVEIVILIFMLGAFCLDPERDGNFNASKVGAFFILADLGLQIAALTYAGNTLLALRPFVEANCLDLTHKDGVDHHNTLNSIIGGLESTQLLGAIELCALLGKGFTDFKHLARGKDQESQKMDLLTFSSPTMTRAVGCCFMSLGIILQLAQTIMAIIDYEIYTAPAKVKLNTIFASNFELDGSKWCVQPMNSTLECLAGQNKLDILGYSSTSNTGGYGSLNAGVRRLGSSLFGSP